MTTLSAATTSGSDTEPERVVRRAWLDFLDRGWAGMLAHCTEDVEWTSLLAAGRPAVGHDGIRQLFEGLRRSGVSHTAAPYRYGCLNGRVIVSVDVCVTDGDSRDPDYHAYLVYDLAGDKIARIREFVTPQQALEAAEAQG